MKCVLRYFAGGRGDCRIVELCAAMLCAWLCLNTPTAQGAVGHVIHISVDGLRGDLLKTRIDANPELYPNFMRFIQEGATTFNARTDYTDLQTLPNHTSMLTARPVLRPIGAPSTVHHGWDSNGDPGPNQTLHNSGNPNLSYIASTFDVAHDHGLSTALYAGKSKFALFDQSYNSSTGAVDLIGINHGRDKIDSFTIHPNAHGRFFYDFTVNHFGYSFLHYLHPDGAGHSAGWESETWATTVQFVDAHLGSIMNYVQAKPELVNDTILILTADHGGTGTAHDSAEDPANYTVPVLVWGHGVSPGADLYELNADTRQNPGILHPDYNAMNQPIRNGDTGNLALSLLGLNAVPGSSINSDQDLRVRSPFSADFNGDLVVDNEDLAVWQAYFGSSTLAPSLRGDADGDRDVDGFDFLIWQQQVGGSVELFDSLNSVPEPHAVISSVLCAMILLACGRGFVASRSAKLEM